MSFRQVRKPQAKNRVETMAIARWSVFSGAVRGTVAGPDWLKMAMAGPRRKLLLVYLNIQCRKFSSPGPPAVKSVARTSAYQVQPEADFKLRSRQSAAASNSYNALQ